MPDDMILNLDLVSVNIEKRSVPFLKDCEVNFDNDTFGGQLTIKAPNARLPNISPDSSVVDRINYLIYNERPRYIKTIMTVNIPPKIIVALTVT